MDAMEYLEQDTWSTLQMEGWELAALDALLKRVEPQTPAETTIRQRILDADHRRRNRRVPTPSTLTDLGEHLRTMHGTLVYNMGDYETEHNEQHAKMRLGLPDLPDEEFVTPHAHWELDDELDHAETLPGQDAAEDIGLKLNPDDDIDMLAVVERVRAKGYDAVAEHTGGGCASIFAGPVIKDGHGDDRYAASAGPGSINGWRASTTEFYLGPDDDVPDPVIKVTTADPEEIAILIVDQIVRSVRARSGGTSWTPESPSTA